MLVDETTETEVHATPPTVAVAPVTNPAPVIVIPEPPAVLPDVGEIELTVGGPTTVMVSLPQVYTVFPGFIPKDCTVIFGKVTVELIVPPLLKL
jgi:hypothetical protein